MDGIGKTQFEKTQLDLRAMNCKEAPSSKLSDDFPISFLYMEKMSCIKIRLLRSHLYIAELSLRLRSMAPLNLCSFPSPMSSGKTITTSCPRNKDHSTMQGPAFEKFQKHTDQWI